MPGPTSDSPGFQTHDSGSFSREVNYPFKVINSYSNLDARHPGGRPDGPHPEQLAKQQVLIRRSLFSLFCRMQPDSLSNHTDTPPVARVT